MRTPQTTRYLATIYFKGSGRAAATGFPGGRNPVMKKGLPTQGQRSTGAEGNDEKEKIF
jgi:hypothetical protein